MRAKVLARTTHKWLALVVGAQMVVWALSGLYMVAIHIDIIHGDHLVRQRPPQTVGLARLADPMAIARSAKAQSVRLAFVRNQPAYVLDGNRIVDAITGQAVAPPSEAEIRAIASTIYTGDDPIASVRLIADAPTEIRGREPPLWRVEFDQWNKPTFYLSPVTGELVTRRHELWRAFDFLWMLHVMDYETRDNVNNMLLVLFSVGAVLVSLTGGWMLFYAFARKKKA